WKADPCFVGDGLICPGAVDAHPEYHPIVGVELARLLLILRHLVRAARRKGGREKREHDVFLSLELAELDLREAETSVLPFEVRRREVRSRLTHFHARWRWRRGGGSLPRSGRREQHRRA